MKRFNGNYIIIFSLLTIFTSLFILLGLIPENIKEFEFLFDFLPSKINCTRISSLLVLTIIFIIIENMLDVYGNTNEYTSYLNFRDYKIKYKKEKDIKNKLSRTDRQDIDINTINNILYD